MVIGWLNALVYCLVLVKEKPKKKRSQLFKKLLNYTLRFSNLSINVLAALVMVRHAGAVDKTNFLR